MATQTILLTVMPRGISVDPETMPVSVSVSPRLYGDAKLGAFPDWLNWTRYLKEKGISFTFACGTQTVTQTVPTALLRPELWEAMFKESTFVRSHSFDDYSDRAIISPSIRSALSVLKGMYQKAGVELALPARGGQREQGGNYYKLKQLVDGLAVNWNENLRDRYRDGGKQLYERLQYPLRTQAIGSDGLFQTPRLDSTQLKNVHTGIANEFAVFHHVPTGTPISERPPDFEHLIDFHQALSSLNSYPELLRALGLVIDFELPKEFVAITTANQPGTLSVSAVTPNWTWGVPTTIPTLQTAYLHTGIPTGSRIFLTAPRSTIQTQPQTEPETLGLLILNQQKFGLAQVDVDGGMHKTIMLAEMVQDGDGKRPPTNAPHSDVFDPNATLSSLRSSGFSLFADARDEKLLNTFKQSKAFNDALSGNQPQPRPFYAEDLIHGYRLDVWSAHTNQWNSLHRRNGVYTIEDKPFTTTDEEGFTQLSATQAPPNPDKPPANDLYLHQAIARWAGWSLSVPFPGKHLSSDPDPDKAIPDDAEIAAQNEPATPFKMTTNFKIVANSLPSLRFGWRYRLRARVVDLCGNSLKLDNLLLAPLSQSFALPADPEGAAYLRYEPVIAPQVVLKDARGVTDVGSSVDRLVIRSFNTNPAQDGIAADRTASDRHILPPRTSVELAERMGMLDDASGKLNRDPAMYRLIAAKDGAELNQITVPVAGKDQQFPLESSDRVDTLPYIPDALSRGAALRDLPGTPDGMIATIKPGTESDASVPYTALNDPNPRPGSATLISFDGESDWQTIKPFRLALDEGTSAPHWDAQNRILTAFLPKGTTKTVPLTSYLKPNDLKLMGVWQWLREYIDDKTTTNPDAIALRPKTDADEIAHILQLAVEGGHWMITPPRLLTLVHAVQQPIGVPTFTALTVQHQPYDLLNPDPTVLQAESEAQYSPTAATELDAITAWRKPGSTDAYLLGGLSVHAASTAKVDILAEWEDPIDDLNQLAPGSIQYSAPVDEVPLNQLTEHQIYVNPDFRSVGYYDVNHDLLCFARSGDKLGNLSDGVQIYPDAAPKHQLNDTKHHRIRYTARSTSRYHEYFPQDKNLDFTRTSNPITVDVPASTRPLAPQIAYVIPTFGWQRQTETNLKRSVRFGGGLRVYLERPWFSSGEGELLGVALYNGGDITNQRDRWKSFITQWGNDPIWQTSALSQTPSAWNFPDSVAQESSLNLEEGAPGQVSVVGYPVAFDEARQKWYCDLTVTTGASSYTPFIRLALVRYQPHAIQNAKLSRVVLADFAQLTPDRAAVVMADPYHPRQLRVTVSGVVPQAPQPQADPNVSDRVTTPTKIELTVQQLDPTLNSDLAWQDVPQSEVTIAQTTPLGMDQSVLWTGLINFAQTPAENQFRLLIREYEYVSAEYTNDEVINDHLIRHQPRRLIYAEAIVLDQALIGEPPISASTTTL